MSFSVSQILGNPGLLKLELMRKGLRIEPSVLRSLDTSGSGVTGHALFGSAGDIDISLPQGTWVTAPVAPRIVKASPYRLVVDGDQHLITADASAAVVCKDDEGAQSQSEPQEAVPRVPVTVQPPASFFRRSTSSGIPLRRIGTVHGPYLALSPTNKCGFLATADRCRFCGVSAQPQDAVPVADIVEAIRIAREEQTVNMVHLSVGYLGTDDGGVRMLEPYVAAIKKHFDIVVAVDALPPADNGWIDRTYGMGADAISYNLEIFDAQRFEKICPGPARVIGRERFMEALEYATTVFQSGGVTCHLIVGLEPLDSTREGIQTLTGMGVVPVLPIYRPFKGRDMRADEDIERFEPTLGELGSLYRDLYRQVRNNRLGLSMVRDIATVTTPLEGRFFDGEPNFLRSLADRLTGTRIGRRTSARFSDLRRALRVRDVTIVEP